MEQNISIKSIVGNDGKRIDLNEDDIVIFVGANNVGKTRSLKDIMKLLVSKQEREKNILIKELEIKTNNVKDMGEKILSNSFKYYDNYATLTFENEIHSFSSEREIINQLEYITNEQLGEIAYFCCQYLSTEERLQLTRIRNFNNNNHTRLNSMAIKILENKEYLKQINENISNAFNKGINVKYESFMDSNIYMQYKIGDIDKILQSAKVGQDEREDILKQMENLVEQGDGIRSFVSIIISLIVDNKDIIFIDEPETFLHPPQARLIGEVISELSKNKQCFISTHNIDFLKGIANKYSGRLKIIRITRDEDDKSTFNVLDNQIIDKLFKDSLIRHSNILDALFYKKVILCESESDCKMYSIINDYINPNEQILFIPLNGKARIGNIMKALFQIGISASSIIDIDLFNDGIELSNLLENVGCSKEEISELIGKYKIFKEKFNLKQSVLNKKEVQETINKIINNEKGEYISETSLKELKKTLEISNKWYLLKEAGESCIPRGEAVEAFEYIVDTLKSKHINIVTKGELECFIKTIGEHGPKWVDKVLETYPDLDNEVYSDIKKFISEIN